MYKEKQAESQNREHHHQEISEVFTHCPVNILLFIFCQYILKIFFEWIFIPDVIHLFFMRFPALIPNTTY